MLLVEFHGTEAGVAEQAARFGEIVADNGGGSFIWATKPEERTKLWKARHDGFFAQMSLRPGARPFATDTCVPISRLADCVEETLEDIAASRPRRADRRPRRRRQFPREPAGRHGEPGGDRGGGSLRLPPRPSRHRHGRHLHRRARRRPEEDRLHGGRARGGGGGPDAPGQGRVRSRGTCSTRGRFSRCRISIAVIARSAATWRSESSRAGLSIAPPRPNRKRRPQRPWIAAPPFGLLAMTAMAHHVRRASVEAIEEANL